MEFKPQRLHFIDNLRILLAILVISFHSAITYGPMGSWYYHERVLTSLSNLTLGWFYSVVQSFLISLFLLISGYFTWPSMEKVGIRNYIRNRSVRLLLPVFFYIFVVHPALIYWVLKVVIGYERSYFSFFSSGTFFSIGITPLVGPLWFVWMLFIFEFFSLLVFHLLKKFKMASFIRKQLTYSKLVVLLIVISVCLATFYIRIFYPVESWFFSVRAGYIAQYIAFFIVGVYLGVFGKLETLLVEVGRWIGYAILVCLALTLVLVFTGYPNDYNFFWGGLTLRALLYAFWEQILGMVLSLCLLLFFFRKLNKQGKILQIASENTYAVFFVHAPILMLIQVLVGSVLLYPIVKFALVTFLAVCFSFVLSQFVVRKLPLVGKILY